MRKVKRFAAIVLTAALLSPTTAYAGNVEDAKALYEQVTEKQKSVTDMNAYYDYQSFQHMRLKWKVQPLDRQHT